MARQPFGKPRAGAATEGPRRGLTRGAISRMGEGDGFASVRHDHGVETQ